MSDVMMLSRELKRVPLDFDAPVGKTWQPLLESPVLPPCPVCGPGLAVAEGIAWDGERHGDGFSLEYRQLEQTWYALFLAGFHDNALDRARRDAIRWDNKLGQPEVDALVEAGRFNPVIECPKGCETPEKRGIKQGEPWKTDCPECEGRGWTRKKLKAGDVTAAEVNEWNDGDGIGHGGLNRHIAIEARCKLLGFETGCSGCDGDGMAGTPEERKAYEEWEPPEVPEGSGYQLWQSISEGGPVSPVLETAEALADWLAENYAVVGNHYSSAEWLQIIDGKKHAFEIGTGALA